MNHHHRAWMKRRFFVVAFLQRHESFFEGSKRSAAPELMAGVVAVPGNWSPFWIEISKMEMSTKNSVISTDFNYFNQEFSGDFINQGRTTSQFSTDLRSSTKKGRTLLLVAASEFGFAELCAMPFRIHLLMEVLTWQKTTTSYWCF